MYETLKKIYLRMRPYKIVNVSVQKKYINRLGKPSDNFERSYLQYKCWTKIVRKFCFILYNLAAILLYFFQIFKYKKADEKEKQTPVITSEKAVFYGNFRDKKWIPQKIYDEFGEPIIIESDRFKFCKSDYLYFRKNMKKFHMSFYFKYKNLIKMGIYRWMIDEYNPAVIIVNDEFSFTSSFLTDFCNVNGVEHIDVMHGEKYYFIRDSFFKYNRCYVWDKHYINIFTELRADTKQFVIALPECLSYKLKFEKIVDYTYYLQAESVKDLKKIAEILHLIKNSGYCVAYRPHPTYDLPRTRDILAGFEREENIGIEQSVLRTRNVIAKSSTVLYEAYLNGTNIVIDDITNKHIYINYIVSNPIILNKPHMLLSEVLKSLTIQNKNI